MNKQEQNEAELKDLRKRIEDIPEVWETASFNGDGDATIYDEHAIELSRLLEL